MLGVGVGGVRGGSWRRVCGELRVKGFRCSLLWGCVGGVGLGGVLVVVVGAGSNSRVELAWVAMRVSQRVGVRSMWLFIRRVVKIGTVGDGMGVWRVSCLSGWLGVGWNQRPGPLWLGLLRGISQLTRVGVEVSPSDRGVPIQKSHICVFGLVLLFFGPA